jgi:hypothetical protein
MLILDTLILGGLRFVLGKIAAAVDSELNDDSALREELLAAQMRLELGEITDEEFAAIERDLLQRISEIRRARTGSAPGRGRFKVTGVEATFTGDEHVGDQPGAGRGR